MLQQILLFEYKKDNKIKFTIDIVLLMHNLLVLFISRWNLVTGQE